jgi:hypothetical protein
VVRTEVREWEFLTKMMHRHLPEVTHPLLSDQRENEIEKEREDGEGVLFPQTATGVGV